MGSAKKIKIKKLKNDSRENSYPNSHGRDWWIGGWWLIFVMIDRWVIEEAKKRKKRELNVKNGQQRKIKKINFIRAWNEFFEIFYLEWVKEMKIIRVRRDPVWFNIFNAILWLQSCSDFGFILFSPDVCPFWTHTGTEFLNFLDFFFQEISQSNNEIFSNLFSKVLMASAATNALRLHQRIPAFQLNAQTFQNILAEDSGHYLAYSLMFLTGRHKLVYHYKVIRVLKRY